MVEQGADISGTQYNGGRVYSSQYCKSVKQHGFESFLQDFIRDMMQKGVVKLQYTSTDE
jgi:hypothetical protein